MGSFNAYFRFGCLEEDSHGAAELWILTTEPGNFDSQRWDGSRLTGVVSVRYISIISTCTHGHFKLNNSSKDKE